MKKLVTLLRKAALLALALLLMPALAHGQDRANPKEKRLLPPSVVEQYRGLELSPEARERVEETIRARRAAKRGLATPERKLGSLLLGLAEGAGAQPGQNNAPGGHLLAAPDHPLFDINAEGVQVGIRLESVAAVGALEDAGASIGAVYPDERLVVARVPVGRLKAVAALGVVEDVQPILGGITQVGSVTSGGVGALNVGEAREMFGLTGAGVKVAVISDGTGGLADAQASDDLPAEVEQCGLNTNSGAEGTAMLEIVHDLAPDADLAFCPAFGNGELGLSEAILFLANDAFGGAGADVIVDDVAFLTEPYFEDGPVAQAVDAAADGGTAYFSSAGNSATSHYERPYFDVVPGDQGFPLNVHDFGQAAGLGSDIDWNGVVAGEGNFFAAFLQWTEPFGAASSDYDLYLFDRNGFPAGDPTGDFPVGGLGLSPQDGDDAPLEVAFVVNNNSTQPADPIETALPFFIVIDRFDGEEEELLEMNFNGFFGLNPVYNVAKGSVWGHAAARGAQAVAAIDVNDPGLDDIEPFSSRGPARIFFPEFEARQKPDMTAVDGVQVTGAGGFPSVFFGTSAAAPHAAAVAALLQEADPSLGSEETESVLGSTARDRGAPGFDFVFGAGLIDAFAAAETVLDAAGDETPPVCGQIVVDRGASPPSITSSAVDEESGIASITYTRLKNLDGFYDAEDAGSSSGLDQGDAVAFNAGAVEEVTFGGTLADASRRRVAIIVTVENGAGLTSRCDPVVSQVDASVPVAFSLGGNYPNPVRGATTIGFAVAEEAQVTLEVFDVLGRKVATLVDEEMAPSSYQVEWAPEGLPSGVYLYRMRAGSFSASGQMALVK